MVKKKDCPEAKYCPVSVQDYVGSNEERENGNIFYGERSQKLILRLWQVKNLVWF